MRKVRRRTTDDEIERRVRQQGNYQVEERVIQSARYLPGLDILRFRFTDGARLDIPRKKLEGLREASFDKLKEITVFGVGTGIGWKRLDACFSAKGLLKGHYGSPTWMRMLKTEESPGRSTSSHMRATA